MGTGIAPENPFVSRRATVNLASPESNRKGVLKKKVFIAGIGMGEIAQNKGAG
jgi:hypothetical protein